MTGPLASAGLHNVLQAGGCEISWGRVFQWKLTGRLGALALGALYGMLAGVCTFGFLAPMLAMILVNGEVVRGIVMTVVFGAGHCTPIVLAGVGESIAETKGYQKFGWAVRRWASLLIVAFGVFFIFQGL